MKREQSGNLIRGPWPDAPESSPSALPGGITIHHVTVNNVYPQGGIPIVIGGSSAGAVSLLEGARSKMPGGWITSFIDMAMKEATVEQLPNGIFYGEIPSCEGVWAEGETREACLRTLQEALEDWILFKLRDNDKDFPVYGDIDLNAEWKEDVSWAGSE